MDSKQHNIRILTVFGTRPEAVKMAPVIQELNKRAEFDSYVCVTAQHRQMLDQVLSLFNINPDFDLNLMRPNQTLTELTSAILLELDPVLTKYQPDWVLVQGDTTTVMVASLLSYYHKVRVGHIEAGLRTGNKLQPFPEEVNRRVASIIADLNFAPTEAAKQNLIKEGISTESILVTGNPVIDAMQHAAKIPPTIEVHQLFERLGISNFDKQTKSSFHNKIILITAHRRENFGSPFEEICKAIKQLAAYYPGYKFVYPVHLNPNVQEPVFRLLSDIDNIYLLPPLDYLPWIYLLKRATILLTDSGGLQEEAPGLGVPVLVLREVTERPEGIQAGTLRLVGTDSERIVKETRRLLEDPIAYQEMTQAKNPYGDGQAAKRIVQGLIRY